MSVMQVEELVSYQLRTAYLNEINDGVGERLITLNEGFLSSAPFKAAGWRSNPAHIKRTHSPPIPTAVASEYFQAPRVTGLTLEDDADDGGAVVGGPAAPRRRRRREQMQEDDDSSDLSDESDDEPDQRAAQQIKFAKMPLRHRSGSSPIQSSNLRQSSTLSSPCAPTIRRGSQSALETVKERARRDTVTSSEVSSENEFDASGFQSRRPEPNRGPAKTVRLQTDLGDAADLEDASIKRRESEPLAEEQDDSDDSESSAVGSIDSVTLLNPDENAPKVPQRTQIVGTPPRQFTRRSTIRKSMAPVHSNSKLPPPRPMTMVRPLSMIQPKSLLSAALNAKKTKPANSFESFASLSGQGDPNPIRLRIYPAFSKEASKPFEVLINRTSQQGQGGNQPVTVADLIGLSLWRYKEEKREPPLPADKLNVNWFTLRMVEEDGEVDEDFPPLDRKKQLISFTNANNRAARGRSNSKVYDEFALVQASASEFAENQKLTPQFDQEEETKDDELTPRNTPMPDASMMPPPPPAQPKGPSLNPIITTTFRPNAPLADSPAVANSAPNVIRGRKKLLRIHIHSADVAPGQMVTLDVTTDTYLEEVLDLVCRKRQLDKGNHVLKLPGSGAVVLLDREVSSIGNVADLELHRRRFGAEGSFTTTGSPGSSSPNPFSFGDSQQGVSGASGRRTNMKKATAAGGGAGSAGISAIALVSSHPLAQQTSNSDEMDERSKTYVVSRKGTLRSAERILSIEGEYMHIIPSSGGKPMVEATSKTATVHFSNVIGVKVSRRHPTVVKLSVYFDSEKTYEFEAKTAVQASELVYELKNRIAPYREV
ncbi:hypothetical protein MGG_12955 [Pyricularia oryzae 70-15]|uniref:Stress-activated map kinase-interacting protein n=3 Tax=Pyricularia oryzae TaxID=318829 RepID=G4N3T1_PYRO7|nr:uncharacterized protein MGG_12955 [Pyricularia oryzae 70-15]EHA52704.1 hypothetical protein MGG_12955 [Pyricularia oryzae 70-15]ELQ43048.1 hypothetical protein OOU_Y34scaffold00174g13 [Pyricularia oryzae Y34]KAI7915582.1 hypothetical protein M9X92_008332 [Pyricularia oryzae]KAI7929054.1 hypothetical protein M0657_002490 [Pyricularia oryzae]